MKNISTLMLAAIFSYFTGTSSPKFFSPATPEFAQFRSNLYIIAADASTVLMDGTLTQYDTDYSNAIDGKDARKMFNPSENFGMLRGSTVLIIERRHTIEENDSIFFKMWNMRIISYQLELIASNLNRPGRAGILEDTYLKTATPLDLNGTSLIRFSVTSDAASQAPDRFRVVFSIPANTPIPVTFTSVTAFQQNNAVSIDWKTANENNVEQYNIEKSVDKNNFVNSTDIKANNSTVNNYHWVDEYPAEGNNYYRIRSIGFSGMIVYSEVRKVYIEKRIAGIKIYPNPATANNLNLQMINQQPGIYEVRLMNSFGQTFITKSIQHAGGSSIENLKTGQSIPKGIYQLEIKTPGGEKKVINVVF